jgi:hypothetical protein
MTDPALYPWQLDPKLTPAVWGGDELVRTYGKRGNVNDKVAGVMGMLGRGRGEQRPADGFDDRDFTRPDRRAVPRQP